MEKRYTGLKAVSLIFKILGTILGVLAIIAIVGVCLISVVGGAGLDQYARQLGQDTGSSGMISGALFGFLTSVGMFLGLGIPAIMMIAFGQLIDLLIDLETNTRTTAQLLQRQGYSNYMPGQTGPGVVDSSRVPPLPGTPQFTS